MCEIHTGQKKYYFRILYIPTCRITRLYCPNVLRIYNIVDWLTRSFKLCRYEVNLGSHFITRILSRRP